MNDRWHYAVPLMNERTGDQALVIVELTAAERADAAQNLLMPFELQDSDDGLWPPARSYYLSHHALAGLPPDCGWTVPYSEITRITLH